MRYLADPQAEPAVALTQTEERLCCNLCDEDFSYHLNARIICPGDDKITTEMVIAIDPGDIMKPYAKGMEKLCGFCGGSAAKGAKGYHLCQVTAANLECNKVVPLHFQAFSDKQEGCISTTQKK